MEQLGRKAVELLIKRIEVPDEPFRQIRLEEELMVRGSSGPVPNMAEV